MIECNYSWQWHMECLQATLCLGALVRKLPAFHCFFSNKTYQDIWKEDVMIHNLYHIYDTKMRPSFTTSKDSRKVFMTFLYLFTIYLYTIYIHFIHHVCHLYSYTSLSRCSGLVRLGAHCPARRTVGDGVTWQHCWGHLAALLMIQKS